MESEKAASLNVHEVFIDIKVTASVDKRVRKGIQPLSGLPSALKMNKIPPI
jgi:hypothetical protein